MQAEIGDAFDLGVLLLSVVAGLLPRGDGLAIPRDFRVGSVAALLLQPGLFDLLLLELADRLLGFDEDFVSGLGRLDRAGGFL